MYYIAVSQATKRLENRIRKDNTIRAMLDYVLEKLKY